MKHKKVKRNKYSGVRCDKRDILVCPLCGAKWTAEEWDEESYKMCRTREERRDFRSVTLNISKRTGEQALKFYYQCKCCQTLISGDRFEEVIKCDSKE